MPISDQPNAATSATNPITSQVQGFMSADQYGCGATTAACIRFQHAQTSAAIPNANTVNAMRSTVHLSVHGPRSPRRFPFVLPQANANRVNGR